MGEEGAIAQEELTKDRGRRKGGKEWSLDIGCTVGHGCLGTVCSKWALRYPKYSRKSRAVKKWRTEQNGRETTRQKGKFGLRLQVPPS